VLLFDKLMLAQGIGPQASRLAQALRRERSFVGSVRAATTEAVGHLGGYVFLIVMSQALGGVIERSGLIQLAPEAFGSTVSAMAFMVVALVALGMLMEPLGAIFLVSGSLAPLAVANGVSPLHFWVMALVAFELGYLMPPIALNQMLARRALGRVAPVPSDAMAEKMSFYRRHERWILPCGVMTLVLLVVAFLPLMWPHDAPHGAWFAQRLGIGAR
jgi:TRAP-type C4-dicarboxylate transport system permease large subunit